MVKEEIKLASFDLETKEGFDENDPNKRLGISCLGIALDPPHPDFAGDYLVWHSTPDKEIDFKDVIVTMKWLVVGGYKFLTWNGAKFDFFVLAQESGMWKECAKLASLYHIDMMLLFMWNYRHFLGLQASLTGSGVGTKRKSVTLNNGDELKGMSGAMAPKLWADGEYKAVLSYLKDDCFEPIKLARLIEEKNTFYWVTKQGRRKLAIIPQGLATVHELIAGAAPVYPPSWMTSVPDIHGMYAWIEEYM